MPNQQNLYEIIGIKEGQIYDLTQSVMQAVNEINRLRQKYEPQEKPYDPMGMAGNGNPDGGGNLPGGVKKED